VGLSNAARTAPEQTGNGPQLSPSAADFQPNIPIQATAQAQIERNPCAVREAKLELLREAVHEACAFIQLHANVCQDLAEAGDNAGLIHSLGRLVIYTKHAARVGNELRDLRKAPP
jgi:hypothetical protein